MANFSQAIEAGIKNARSADVANKEIDTIFGELNDSVQKSTEGRVVVRLDEDSMTKALTALKRGSKFETVLNIQLVSSNDPTKRRAIATLSRSATGYPIQLIHDFTTMSVNDASGLRSALSNVLTRTDVGRSILELAHVPRSPTPSGSSVKRSGLRRRG